MPPWRSPRTRSRWGASTASIPHRGLHQSDARPSGFPRHMETYFAAKQMLFEGAGGPPPRFAVLNRDDEWARRIKVPPAPKVLWYGLGPDAGSAPRTSLPASAGCASTCSTANALPIESPLIGKINVYNILAACGAASRTGSRRKSSRAASPPAAGAGTLRARRRRPALRRGGGLCAHRRCAAQRHRGGARTRTRSASSRCSAAAATATAPSVR